MQTTGKSETFTFRNEVVEKNQSIDGKGEGEVGEWGRTLDDA